MATKKTATKATEVIEDINITNVRNAVIRAIETKRYPCIGREDEYDVSGRTCMKDTIAITPLTVPEGSSAQYSTDTRKHEPITASWLAISGYVDVDGKEKVRIFLASQTAEGMVLCWLYKRKDQSLYSKVTYTNKERKEVTVPLTRGAIDAIATAAFPTMVEAQVASNPWMSAYLLPQPVASPETVISKELLSHLTD